MTSDPDSGPEARVARELLRPAAYAHPVSEVGFLQTHISRLFFAGERVYKVKKPVDLGFLDFTTLDRRRHYCEEEVRLNRRLAPETYLGVVPITEGPDGWLRIGGPGTPLEWAVEMVRLPQERMLSSLLDRGEIDNQKVHALASLLSDFHARSASGPGVDEHGSPQALAANAEQNFEQLQDFVGAPPGPTSAPLRVLSPEQHAFLERRARAWLAASSPLLERRVRGGRIREGHGDLHADNVCFTDAGLVAFDCIEFSAGFRCGDVAADLAFLAMDLDCRGYPAFSAYLVKRYARVAGDPELEQVIGYYKGYRAVVRGKVAAMTAADPMLEAARREELGRQAMGYLQLAAAYELPAAMILTCGLPASGKSWLAKRLAGPLRAAVLASDVRRKLLAGIPVHRRIRPGYESGLYAPEVKERTYRSLLADALRNLRAGHSVIVDASFSRRVRRAPFIDAAVRLGLPYYLIHVSADERVTRERLARREREPGTPSDADLEVYRREAAAFEPPAEVPDGHVVECRSGEGAPEAQSSLVIDRMIALHERG